MIEWPCIFKLDGDDELMFLSSEAMLYSELEALIWSDADVLIDSNGQCYRVRQNQGNRLIYEREDDVSLEFVTELIQAHEFAKVAVCITKIRFLSVQEAIGSLSQ